MNITQFLFLIGSGIAGLVFWFYWLKNKNQLTTFQNVFSSFLLTVICVPAAAWVVTKANFFSWFTCLAFAGGAALLTSFFLRKKDYGNEGMRLSGTMNSEDKSDIAEGLRNVGILAAAFLLIIWLDGTKFREALFVVPAILMGGAGWLFTRNKSAALRWAVLGFVFGILAYLAL